MIGIDLTERRLRITPGVLRAQQLRAPAGVVRLGLVATTALLLGGDEIEIVVRVGDGMRLELRDIAGTVAYDGEGRSCSWRVEARVGAHARLVWAGEPFVVADGAEVDRTLRVDADPTARVLLRETVVLGRHGQRGGALRNRTEIAVDGRAVLIEDQDLVPGGARDLPGIMRGDRILDTLVDVGADPPAPPPGAATPVPAQVGEGTAATFRLPFGAGRITRHLGSDLARSPIGELLDRACSERGAADVR